jgi:hypothetical protein
MPEKHLGPAVWIELPDGFHYADKLTLDQLYEAEEFARQQDSLLALRNVREHIELRLDGPEEASP